MTVKEIYDLACKEGRENSQLTISYRCPDDYYNFFGTTDYKQCLDPYYMKSENDFCLIIGDEY